VNGHESQEFASIRACYHRLLRKRAYYSPAPFAVLQNEGSRADVWIPLLDERAICHCNTRPSLNCNFQPVVIAYQSQRLPHPRAAPLLQNLENCLWHRLLTRWSHLGNYHFLIVLDRLYCANFAAVLLLESFLYLLPAFDSARRSTWSTLIDLHFLFCVVEQTIVGLAKSPLPLLTAIMEVST
jgi:hypothetical protein